MAEKLGSEIIRALFQVEGVVLGLVCTSQGRVVTSHMAEEFNRTSLSVQSSMIRNVAREVADEVGLQPPDVTLIHCPGYYVAYVYLEEHELIVLTIFLETLNLGTIFQTINDVLVNQ
ncbi:MAG: hypothetical protein Kow0069_23290 [Promethearchaeota archaeon]